MRVPATGKHQPAVAVGSFGARERAMNKHGEEWRGVDRPRIPIKCGHFADKPGGLWVNIVVASLWQGGNCFDFLRIRNSARIPGHRDAGP